MNSNDEALELIQLGSVYFRSSDSKEPTQRVLNDQIISFGDYVRVYANTTRYNIHSIDWRKTIIYDSPDFVVVDKPPGKKTFRL